MPNLDVIRPGDANEAAAAWGCAVERCDGPTTLIFSRQKLPILPGTAEKARVGVSRGGYVLREALESAGAGGAAGAPDLILIATGSELQLAAGAADLLEAQGIRTRVVSLPCWERFERQDAAYRESVLPRAGRKRVVVEAASPFGWERFAGDEGAIMGIDHFGVSAPGDEVLSRFGFTVERVAAIGRRVVREGLSGRIETAERGPETC
jgi:transketolase